MATDVPGTVGAPPKLFISYSHDSPDHADRVLALADRLRADGVDATIDQYEPHPPECWPRWMGRQIEAAEVVLLVCTETYLCRVRGEELTGVGLGVSWEANLIYAALYQARAVSGKFIPTLFEESDAALIPASLLWYSL
jgi:TIR domain